MLTFSRHHLAFGRVARPLYARLGWRMVSFATTLQTKLMATLRSFLMALLLIITLHLSTPRKKCSHHALTKQTAILSASGIK